MHEDGLRQRLAAIVAADAVGYSRLMEADERATVAALDEAKAVFRTAIEANHGHVINMVGDSVLALFDAAAGAVTAALSVQRCLDESSRGVPAERRLLFRIGIHLGDVIEKADGEVYGDGVNIAARLQALAEPGGIMVSEAVRGAVKNRVAAAFDDRGVPAIKNISDPIHAFALCAVEAPGKSPRPAVPDAPAPGTAAPAAAAASSRRLRLGWIAAAAAAIVIAGSIALWPRPKDTRTAATPADAALALPSKPSIAVLPFDNMSGDPEQSYFADGITEDLITDLSKVGGLFVVARNSTFVYKGKARDVREVAKALGVRYVLEGSVRKSGGDIRVNAQLIDAATGGHLWADRYDGTLTNLFGLQDTVTRNVVKALSVELTKDDRERVAKRGTGDVQAYDAFLKGWELYLKQTPDDFRAAIVHFRKAIEIDPDYGRANAALAAIYWESYRRYWGQAVGIAARNEDALYGAEQYLAKAMRSPTPLAHQVASAMLVHAQQLEEAIAEAKRAIADDPNDANGYITLASALSFSGRTAEALENVDRAMRLNPHYPSAYPYQRGLAQFTAGHLADAAASLERALAINPDDHWSQRLLLATYGLQGRREDTARLLTAIKEQDRRGAFAFQDPLTIRAVSYWFPFANAADAKRFAAGLRDAGVPE